MKDFVILGDATFNLSEELKKEYDLYDVPSHVILPDGRDIPSFNEWTEFTQEQFYNDLKANPNGFTTAPPNVQEFCVAFEKYLSQGKDILLVTISGGISGTFGFATKAREIMLEKYPDANIRCVDSMRFGPATGLLAVYAALKKQEGCSLDEVADYLEENKNRLHQAGWLDDLSFVAKKGRMTHAKAFLGTLVGIKPLGEFDYNGLTTVIGKVKGAKTAYAALMYYIENTIENPQDQVIFIAHTCRQAQAETYKKMIEDTFHPKAVHLLSVFPMCGISIGPGLMAAYYSGKPISQDLSEERAILARFENGGNNK